MEIRIGNDIRLNFKLNKSDHIVVFPEELIFTENGESKYVTIDSNVGWDIIEIDPNINDSQSNSIESDIYIGDIKFAKVFFVNTTMQDAWEKEQEKKKKHLRVYHCDPFYQFYESTQYTTYACGIPTYNACPVNCNCCKPKYNLFKYHNKPYEELSRFTFEAPVTILPGQERLQAYFKAFNQVPGEYRVIMQYTVYEDGYGVDNLHTYTIDYGKLFELVYSETPDPKSIVVDVDAGGNIPSKDFINIEQSLIYFDKDGFNVLTLVVSSNVGWEILNQI